MNTPPRMNPDDSKPIREGSRERRDVSENRETMDAISKDQISPIERMLTPREMVFTPERILFFAFLINLSLAALSFLFDSVFLAIFFIIIGVTFFFLQEKKGDGCGGESRN